ncbi:MAG: hypothetical protein A4E20_04720 [Nitrospira sp. SG-bin2]|uniref:hypothetical protein n=1 Tax=Nitrospira cf. moscoviensis SBR1015 TaxID=96242 RepID=UPI000A0B1C75|nr:hypothetical protein [Nitrospira cf. moscoviensis SBR1015]OQW38080.1 MAG: hypothetical protein A4E20_04720 [Nitrospira sp. SG-bin2]
MRVTHAFQSVKADSGDSSLIQPSNWNADHVIEGGALPLQLPIQDGARVGQLLEAVSADLIGADTWNGQLVAVPFVAAEAKTWTRVSIYNETPEAAVNFRLGIYASGADGLPDALLVDAGEHEFDGASEYIDLTISQALSADAVYWLGYISEDASTAVVSGCGDTEASVNPIGGFFFANADAGRATGVAKAQAYGALPASFGAIDEYLFSSPSIWLRTGV